MNTNQLKRFAQDARNKLIEQVSAKLQFVLTHDTAELRGKQEAVKKLKEAQKSLGDDALIEKVAYTWFNRLVALRFMDVNDYQPLGLQVISPATEGGHVSALLESAHAGHLPEDLSVNTAQINDILDGNTGAANPDNEVFRILLVAACNQLHEIFPFLFEKINDYTELLLPEDLTSSRSIVNDVVEGMSAEDCAEVEIIGWLYQFYVSERNEELIQSKKTYKRDELAPASQLFTPKWIVQYMVDNTLGHLWFDHNPKSKVHTNLEYFIKPNHEPKEDSFKSIEDVKFFEPCVGSGHILSYAFDVFYAIYEELGYNANEIPSLILEKNLWGIDIDQRAAQLASFVLMMKARSKYRRFFRKAVQPHVYYYQDFKQDPKFENAMALGSLVKVEQNEINDVVVDESSLFGGQQQDLKDLYSLLGQRYDVVVTNPPYISSSRMEGSVKQYVQKHYPETKSDLFATFILRCLELTTPDGYTGYMTPFVWMFISSYEQLREVLIENHFINNLIQLEYSGFDGATVPVCTFTLRNKPTVEEKGNYIRLSDFKGSKVQGPKTLEAIQDPNCGWFYRANQKDFLKIPGSPIGYWVPSQLLKVFEEDKIANISDVRLGMATADNLKFLRFIWEVNIDFVELSKTSRIEAKDSGLKWFWYAKGGEYRKWYGNLEYVVNWYNDGEEIRGFKDKNGKVRSHNYNLDFIFKKGITWNALTSGNTSFRLLENGIFDNAGSSLFLFNEDDFHRALAVLNSKVTRYVLPVINPTLNYQPGTISKVPIPRSLEIDHEKVDTLLEISKNDWDSRETSHEFKANHLILSGNNDLEEAFDLYKQYWTLQAKKMLDTEHFLESQIANEYGLNDTIDLHADFQELSILSDETITGRNTIRFKKEEILSQFTSYSVGCMFGRYSLYKEGLILANQGETLQDYLTKVGKSESEVSFRPDDNNIIPVLDDEWFEDDIVGRFHAFLKASFGEKNFRKNLDFVEECLGKNMRKYFTKDFYKDHIKRYKKRPIYWMFSSPKGHFNVLVYLHCYTPDTISTILNSYLREFIEKLNLQMKQLKQVEISGSATEQAKARKEMDKLDLMLDDCREYEEILFELASERIALDLDDGVLVNYNKMGKAVAEVAGLNDTVTKKKVREFDWIDTSLIR